eukprot:1201205-Alexandrium_andersonii.AAC.1
MTCTLRPPSVPTQSSLSTNGSVPLGRHAIRSISMLISFALMSSLAEPRGKAGPLLSGILGRCVEQAYCDAAGLVGDAARKYHGHRRVKITTVSSSGAGTIVQDSGGDGGGLADVLV